MKIKKGDNVKILAGKDRDKSGKVIQVLPQRKRIVVEGLNLRIKHARPRKQGEKGQKIQFPASLDISNVMLICSKCNKLTRVGYKVLPSSEGKTVGKKVRICKKCQAVL